MCALPRSCYARAGQPGTACVDGAHSLATRCSCFDYSPNSFRFLIIRSIITVQRSCPGPTPLSDTWGSNSKWLTQAEHFPNHTRLLTQITLDFSHLICRRSGSSASNTRVHRDEDEGRDRHGRGLTPSRCRATCCRSRAPARTQQTITPSFPVYKAHTHIKIQTFISLTNNLTINF